MRHDQRNTGQAHKRYVDTTPYVQADLIEHLSDQLSYIKHFLNDHMLH